MSEPTSNPEVVIAADALGLTRSAQLAHAGVSAGSRSPADGADIDALLKRMQAGDREAAAEFLYRYESRIRRRVRGKLGPDVRRLFDSLDIVSTLGRRLDVYVMSGQLQVNSEAQCLSLLFKMADRALIDKARLFRQMEELEGEDGEFARQFVGRLRDAERREKSGVDSEIQNCMQAMRDPMDRRILSLWLTGEKHNEIAERVRMPHAAVRKRWENIKHTLRERFAHTRA